jgi:G:T-mismatch repair DNA endonuclease (very short patch repair protein)
MESIAEECEEALLKIGFIAKVGIKYYMHGSQLIGCPDVISVHRATVLEFDHERKQFEVLDANAKGEAYRGQIEKVDKGS